jgi:hypothetical protein
MVELVMMAREMSYEVAPATRTTGTETRHGWVVERVSPRRSAASILYGSEDEAFAEARRLEQLDKKLLRLG